MKVIMPGLTDAQTNALGTIASKANDNAVVHKTGAETLDGSKRSTPHALTSSAGSTALDLSLGDVFTLTTAEDSTLAAPTNAVAGVTFKILVTQGATPRTLAYHADYLFPGATVPALPAVAGAKVLIVGEVIGASEVWLTMAGGTGFAR